MTIELENPESDSSVVRIPETDSTINAIRATTSERILPQAKNAAAKKSVSMVIVIKYFELFGLLCLQRYNKIIGKSKLSRERRIIKLFLGKKRCD